MFSHVMIGTNDLGKTKDFYKVLDTLDVPPGRVDRHRVFAHRRRLFGLADRRQPATHSNGGTIGFAASSPEQAKAWPRRWWQDDRRPARRREGAGGKVYLAISGPDGNKICALHRMK